MPPYEILRVSRTRPSREDRLSRAYRAARARLEGQLRGETLDVDKLVQELTPLPAGVRRSLLASADPVLRARVTATLSTPTPAARHL